MSRHVLGGHPDASRAPSGTPQGVFARSPDDPRAPGSAQTRSSVILDRGDRRRGATSIDHSHRSGRKVRSARFRIEGTKGATMVEPGGCFDDPRGEADEPRFGPGGGDRARVTLAGSWFVVAFMGPLRNLQRATRGRTPGRSRAARPAHVCAADLRG